jgi:hypothetical protein
MSKFLVDFPREFRSRDEFFWVLKELAKLHGATFTFPIWGPGGAPAGISGKEISEEKEGSLDHEQVIEGMTVKLKDVFVPQAISDGVPGVSDKRTRWSFGGDVGCKETEVRFAALPHLRPVILNPPGRGAPKNVLLTARIVGAKEDGLSDPQIKKKFNRGSLQAVAHHLKAASPKRNRARNGN